MGMTQKLEDAGFKIWEGKKEFGFVGGGVHGRYDDRVGSVKTRRVYGPNGGYALITDSGLRNVGLPAEDFKYLLEKSGCEAEPKKLTNAQKDRARRKIQMAHPAMARLKGLLGDIDPIDDLIVDIETERLWWVYGKYVKFTGKTMDRELLAVFEAADTEIADQQRAAGVRC